MDPARRRYRGGDEPQETGRGCSGRGCRSGGRRSLRSDPLPRRGRLATRSTVPPTGTTLPTFDGTAGPITPIDPSSPTASKENAAARKTATGKSPTTGPRVTTSRSVTAPSLGASILVPSTQASESEVTWKLAGSCARSTVTFTCNVRVEASDRLQTVGSSPSTQAVGTDRDARATVPWCEDRPPSRDHAACRWLTTSSPYIRRAMTPQSERSWPGPTCPGRRKRPISLLGAAGETPWPGLLPTGPYSGVSGR